MTDIYLQHKILPFSSLIKQELIKLGYNISANNAPTPIIKIYRNDEKKGTSTQLDAKIYRI